MDVNPTDVSRAGWGVVFARGATEEVRSALEPLVAHRRRRVPPDRCKVLEYRPGEFLKDWLKRHGVALGSVTPTKVPYYVLLVGTPDAIPFEFQYLLDIEYAVGRLAFDRPDQYRQYAESVVHYENATAVPKREVVYWGTRHLADRATQMSADGLITPLHQGLPAASGQESESPIAADLGYTSRCLKARDATKASLAQVLHGAGRSAPPAFLFTASHGMGWPKGHERQALAQGRCSARTGRVSARCGRSITWPPPTSPTTPSCMGWSPSISPATAPARRRSTPS